MELIVTEQNFSTDVLQSTVPVLVDFWAPWCGPCRVAGPIVEAVAAEVASDKAKIGKCNVDENGSLATQFGILSIPTMIVFKDGKEVVRLAGVQSKEQILEALGL